MTIVLSCGSIFYFYIIFIDASLSETHFTICGKIGVKKLLLFFYLINSIKI